MIQKICSNPDCKRVYEFDKIDDGFCSFECWEKENCKEPQNEVFEDIKVV